jgi:YNFM family putative membrane transporter
MNDHANINTAPTITGSDQPSQLALRLLAIALCGFCPFLAVYVTQPLLPLLAQAFSASVNAVSITVTATTLAVALTAPLVGLLADALGRKRVIVIAIFGLAVPMALAATSASLNQLIFWRFLQGLFIPGIFSVALAYLGEEWKGPNSGLATSAYIAGNVIGSVSGRLVAGLVATWTDWHYSFIAQALLLVVGGIAVWILLPPSRNFVAQKHFGQGLRAMVKHFSNRPLIAVWAIGFNTLFVFVAVFTYITFRLASAPFDLTTVQLGSMFLLNLFGAVATPFAGRWMDKVGARKVLITALATSAIGLLLTLTPYLAMTFTGLALISMGVFVGNSAASNHLGKVAADARSSAAGLYVCAYYAGGSAGAYVPGLAYSAGGWPACAALIFIVMGASAIIALRFWARREAECDPLNS